MPGASQNTSNAGRPSAAAIFDLDGVLTDTAELHFQSWLELAKKLEIPFDRQANEALRGLSRVESLKIFLGEHAARFSRQEQAEIMTRKNDRYVRQVARMTPDDLLPGARELLASLRQLGVPVAVASSSKNARPVIDRLDIEPLLDAIVDGHDIERSKPDPRVFLLASERLGVPPAGCVVVEDAESGVAAALAAGMKVVGVGPVERVGKAHRVVRSVVELGAESLLALLGS